MFVREMFVRPILVRPMLVRPMLVRACIFPLRAAPAFGLMFCLQLALGPPATAQVRALPQIQTTPPASVPQIQVPGPYNKVPDVKVPQGAQAADVPPQAAARQRIRKTESGTWLPADGCHWLNGVAGDLRVRCNWD
jgi:hypothetical protein